VCARQPYARTFLPSGAIFTSTPHFYHLKPLLRVRHNFTILSHFYECATFLPFEPFLRVRHIFTILINFNKCAIFSLFWDILTSVPLFYHFGTFLDVHHIFTNLSHFYKCATFMPFWAIFSSAPNVYHFKPFLRVRHIFTVSSHFWECALSSLLKLVTYHDVWTAFITKKQQMPNIYYFWSHRAKGDFKLRWNYFGKRRLDLRDIWVRIWANLPHNSMLREMGRQWQFLILTCLFKWIETPGVN